MGSLASVNIKFFADLKQFSSQMQNAQRSIQKMGANMQKLGKNLTIGVTAPLLALGVAGVRAWDEQQKAIAQVNAGLKTTGGTVGYTSEQLEKMAEGLQNITTFGDEAILKDVTSQLLTFTNITQEQFARTQKAALDLATRLDGDLKSASIQLGKALNDPVANLSALSRSGIQFSKDQKAMINSLVETNQLAEAQTIILNELEKQYGGSAEAAAAAGLGPLTQFKNILGDISEDFGAIIGQALLPFVAKLKDIALGFKNLSPEAKKAIVIIGGIAAAVGPLLALAGTILPAIVAGFTLLAGPVGLIVAGLTAIGVVIYQNWTPIKQTLVDIANYFIDLYNESELFRLQVDAIVLAFKAVWEAVKFVFEGMKSWLTFLGDQFKNYFTGIGKIIKAALTGNFDDLKKAYGELKDSGAEASKKLLENLKGDFKGFTTGLSNNLKEAIEGGGKRAKIVLTPDQVDTTAIVTKINAALKPRATAISGASIGVNSVNGENAAGITTEIPELKTASQVEEMNRLARASQNLADVSQSAGSAVGQAFGSMTDDLTNSLGLASTGMEGFVKSLAKSVLQILAQMLSQSIATAIAGANTSAAATGPAYVATAPGFIAASIAAITSAFAAIPKFADGGVVSGATMALVGEYPGASSNPEVIAPLNKLKELIQPVNSGVQEVTVNGVFEIDGRKLKLVLDRTNQQYSRLI